MNLSIIFSIIFLLFSNTLEVNNNEDHTFSEITNKKDYYSLSEGLKKLSFDELIELHKKYTSENYKIGEVAALNNIGRYYKEKREYANAIKYHNKALTICKKEGFIDIQMTSLNLIGTLYRYEDDIKNALEYHQSVIYLAKRIKRKTVQNKISLSIAENNLGNIYASLKLYELAIKQFNKALKLQHNTNNLLGLAINYQNIGEAYENLHQLDKALENYKKSLDFNTKMNSSLGKVICNNSIASVYIKKDRYREALFILKDIFPTAKKLKSKFYTAETLTNLGWVQTKLNNYEIAEDNLNKALTITKDLRIKKLLESKILHHLSELFEKKNETPKALSYYKEAIQKENSIVENTNNIYLKNLISKQDLQSQISEFRELQSETEIKSLQLARNRNILIITLITIALLTAVLYSTYRQHLLKNDQKILMLEQQALQTQMNPHFVFNALNSIKLYIINNEQKNAVYYLNKFSKLIRNILEVSKVKEVSLKEELNTMSLYMSIENIRFDNTIEYTEVIESDLNTDTIKLPPLVLQPFIENAIWHGLSPKENGKKEIILSTKKITENLIEISITDNGIGREAALEIKKDKWLKRKSIGIELTKERLSTCFNEFSTEFTLTYYDLKDSNGNPSGTKASLLIPLS